MMMSQQNVYLIEMQLRDLQFQSWLPVKAIVNLTSPIPKQKDRILYHHHSHLYLKTQLIHQALTINFRSDNLL